MKRVFIVSGLALLLAVGAVKAMTLTPAELDELKAFFVKSVQQSVQQEENLGAGLSNITNPRTQGSVNYTGDAFDIMGTRTGTTTTGIYRGKTGQASSTFPILLDSLATEGVFTVGVTDASSTAAILTFSIWSSNDTSCDTASTSSPTLNAIVTSDINWFDAGNLLRGSSQSNPLLVATTTIGFNPTHKGQNRQIFLENLNSRCLALEVNGSSSAAWIQFKQNSKP